MTDSTPSVGSGSSSSTNSPVTSPSEEATPSSPTSGEGNNGTTVGTPKKRHRFRNFLLLLLFLFALGSAIWTWATVTFAYSTGEKTGFVQELTRQGWLCKTWEGALAVAPAPGAAPEVFAFTIRDDSIASALQRALPARVTLTYEHHRGVPTSCFGETPYYITGFRTVEY
jgi:hypothetical protein